ncbi:MAG: hypothetical protein ACI4XF_04600 [Oscillospiraceae bacterium]
MGYYNTEFYRILSEEEETDFHKNGNIQPHNDIVCPNFEYLTNLSDNFAICDDYFYSQLYSAVKKNELSRSPIPSLIFMLMFAMLFSVICLCFGLRLNVIWLLFGGIIPIIILIYSCYALIREIAKISQASKCVKQRKNIYAVSLKIDGMRTYTDTSGDTRVEHYFIYSEPMIIRVPKKIYSAAVPNKRLTGAVIDTGKEKLFYALYID